MNKIIRILHLEDEEPFERLIKQLLLKENIECEIDRVETLEDFKSAFLKTEYDDIPWLKFDPDLENVRQTGKFWEIIKE